MLSKAKQGAVAGLVGSEGGIDNDLQAVLAGSTTGGERVPMALRGRSAQNRAAPIRNSLGFGRRSGAAAFGFHVLAQCIHGIDDGRGLVTAGQWFRWRAAVTAWTTGCLAAMACAAMPVSCGPFDVISAPAVEAAMRTAAAASTSVFMRISTSRTGGRVPTEIKRSTPCTCPCTSRHDAERRHAAGAYASPLR